MEFLKTPTGRVILSVLWGIGLASLFRKACQGSNCIIIKGPNPNEISKKTFINDGKCFQFQPYIVDCQK